MFGRFATRRHEARFPTLWEGRQLAVCPSVTGPTGLTCYELSPYAVHAALTNMDAPTDWVRSSGLYALDFDGSNDYLPFGTRSRYNASEWSCSLWIKPASTAAGQKSILAQIDSTGNLGRAVRRNANQIEYSIASSGAFAQYKSGTTITTDWTHVAVIVSGVGTPRIWINGAESTVTLTASSGTVVLPAAQPLMIGVDGQFGTTNTTYNFAGLVDDVAVYNRRILSGEVRILAIRRGIAYEPRRDIVFGSTANRRRRLLTGMV